MRTSRIGSCPSIAAPPARTQTSRLRTVQPAAPSTTADCQIAAIAHSRAMTVATRNVRDFEDIGIEVVDPWAGA